jgi:hypothetical protein
VEGTVQAAAGVRLLMLACAACACSSRGGDLAHPCSTCSSLPARV